MKGMLFLVNGCRRYHSRYHSNRKRNFARYEGGLLLLYEAGIALGKDYQIEVSRHYF